MAFVTELPTSKKVRKRRGGPRVRTIPISRKCWNRLVWYWNYMKDKPHRPVPWCGLLGEKNGVVNRFVKTAGHGGCWNMPYIDADDFAHAMTALAKDGYTLVGMVRIGKFQVAEQGSIRGHSMEELYETAPNFWMLSLGLDGSRVETFGKDSSEYADHSYVVVDSVPMNVPARSRTRVKERDHGEENAHPDVSPGSAGDQPGRSEPGAGRPLRAPHQGDVLQAGGAGPGDGSGQRGDAGAVPEQAGNGVQPGGQGEPSGEEQGLHPAGRGHLQRCDQGQRRLEPQLNEVERALWRLAPR